MTNDIVALIDYYEKEKGIDRDKVVAALEYAFISAYRKMVPGADAIEVLRAEVNTKKGETRIFASLKVVPDEEYKDKFNEVPLKLAARRKAYAKLDKRGRYSETVDSILYDSADGYAQARLLYLQNRRYDLGQAEAESDFEDPYAQ